MKATDGSQYRAYGALRLKKFIDAYGASGRTFSVCNSDFTDAMTQIGDAIVQAMGPGCLAPFPI